MGETSPVGRALTAAILVVDDAPAIVRALAYLLRRRGHEMDTAAHGCLALKKLQTRADDLILHDLRLPECDGPALYHELQHRRPQLCQRIIFLSRRRYIMLSTALPCGKRSRQVQGNWLHGCVPPFTHAVAQSFEGLSL